MVSTTTSALTDLLNTVAPPISEHETLELWLTHPLVGYAGVEGVVYRGWTRILEQTESGELVVVWSPPVTGSKDESGSFPAAERSINPVSGWSAAWKSAVHEMDQIKEREEKNPKGRANTNRTCSLVDLYSYGSKLACDHCTYFSSHSASLSASANSRAPNDP